MAYVTWEEYNALFPNLTEDEFTEKLPAIELKIDIYTSARASTAIEYKADAVKYAVCNMLNYQAIQNNTSQGTGITSVSNDGYSESYQAITPQQTEDNLKSIANQWLSGTGLMGAL